MTERAITRNEKRRQTRSVFLTFLLFCPIQEKSQTVGWDGERDSSSDLHGVYSDDFPILIGSGGKARESCEPLNLLVQ